MDVVIPQSFLYVFEFYGLKGKKTRKYQHPKLLETYTGTYFWLTMASVLQSSSCILSGREKK